MNFDSKETYLAGRKEWTANYNHLASEVRRLRDEYKGAQRQFAKTYMPWPIYRQSSDEAKTANYKDLVALQNALWAYGRSQLACTEAIEELHEAKKEAAAQWLAARRPA